MVIYYLVIIKCKKKRKYLQKCNHSQHVKIGAGWNHYSGYNFEQEDHLWRNRCRLLQFKMESFTLPESVAQTMDRNHSSIWINRPIISLIVSVFFKKRSLCSSQINKLKAFGKFQERLWYSQILSKITSFTCNINKKVRQLVAKMSWHTYTKHPQTHTYTQRKEYTIKTLLHCNLKRIQSHKTKYQLLEWWGGHYYATRCHSRHVKRNSGQTPWHRPGVTSTVTVTKHLRLKYLLNRQFSSFQLIRYSLCKSNANE